MPNIASSDIEGPTIHAESGGSEAFEIAGRHIAADYRQIGEDVGKDVSLAGNAYVQHTTNMQTIDHMAIEANQDSQIYKQIDDAAAQDFAAHGSDPDWSKNLMNSKVLPLLQEGSDSFSTEEGKTKYGERANERYRRFSDYAYNVQVKLRASATLQSVGNMASGGVSIAQRGFAAADGIKAYGEALPAEAAKQMAATGGASPEALEQLPSLQARYYDTAARTAADADILGAGRTAVASDKDPAPAMEQAWANVQADPNWNQWADGKTKEEYASEHVHGLIDQVQHENTANQAAAMQDSERYGQEQMFKVEQSMTAPDGTVTPTGQGRAQLSALMDDPRFTRNPGNIKALRTDMEKYDAMSLDAKEGKRDVTTPDAQLALLRAQGSDQLGLVVARLKTQHILSNEDADVWGKRAEVQNSDPQYKLLMDTLRRADTAAVAYFSPAPSRPGAAISRNLQDQNTRNHFLWLQTLSEKIETARTMGVPPAEIVRRYMTPGSPEDMTNMGVINGYRYMTSSDAKAALAQYRGITTPNNTAVSTGFAGKSTRSLDAGAQ